MIKKPGKTVNNIKLPQEYKNNYIDGLIWPETLREEAMDGLFYLQASPSWKYQTVLFELSRQFVNYLIRHSYLIYNTPFDLRIPGTGEADADNIHIFRPDIVILSNSHGERGVDYFRPPSLIVEITSPMTGKWDRVLRLNKYEEIGTGEYWVIESEGKYICVFTLKTGRGYEKPEVYTCKDKVRVSAFPDLVIDLTPVFAFV